MISQYILRLLLVFLLRNAILFLHQSDIDQLFKRIQDGRILFIYTLRNPES